MPPLKEDFELALCGWFASFVTWGGLVCLERRLLSILQGWGVLEEVVVLVIQHWEESGILLKLDLKGIKLKVTFARVVTEDFECQWFIDIPWKSKGKELVPDWSYLGIQGLYIVLTKSNERVWEYVLLSDNVVLITCIDLFGSMWYGVEETVMTIRGTHAFLNLMHA